MDKLVTKLLGVVVLILILLPVITGTIIVGILVYGTIVYTIPNELGKLFGW